MFRKMPFILLAIIFSLGLCSQWIPVSYQSIFYAISLSIKSFIIFVLPFVVFGLLFKTAVHFANKASKMILLILVAICCSNFLSTLLSYSVGTFAYQFDMSMSFPNEASALAPAWEFSFPKWIGNGQAMFSGLILGMVLGWALPSVAKTLSSNLEKMINIILKCILFVIPFFIAGFVIKMDHDQVMSAIFRNYTLIFVLIASALFAYVTLIYFVVNRFRLDAALRSMKNIAPAAIAGFGSMSSAAVMPLTILGAEKNSNHPDLARSIIPATVNIHLIGDCFAIPIFAFAVMKGFGVAEPMFLTYLIFAAYFVLAKFSVAAVPGGGILVMLPILETYLGFNGEMLSLMTALYILFDPVITCANVMGNGGFAMVIEKLSRALEPTPPHLTDHPGSLQEQNVQS
jgi:Na+/H+-dicarboxylate symporter